MGGALVLAAACACAAAPVPTAATISNPNPVSFGSQAVNTALTQTTVTFTVTASGMLDAAPLVLTTGAPNLDYTLGTGSTCMGAVAAGTCTVNVVFTPNAPGQRMGAVVLSFNGTAIATALLYGTGVGPAVVFPGNASRIALGSGFTSPSGAAVDGAGNVFVADYNNNAIKEIVAVGGSIPATSPTIRTLGSGFNYPFGVAVDGAGNVYVADTNNSAIKEIVAVGGSIPATSPTIRTLGGGFSYPQGVAVDGAGNVYVADTNNSAVREILSVGGSIPAMPTSRTLGSSFSYPQGVAVDGAGNVYVADTNNSAVKEIVAVGGSIPATNPTNLTLGSGFSYPYGVAVDGAGNVYVADTAGAAVKEIVAVGGSIPTTNPTVRALGGVFSAPKGLAVDGAGNVYVTDNGQNSVTKIPLAVPPSVGFASTSVGNTSSDSPQTLLMQNIGNANLTFPVPASGPSPAVSSNYTLSASSTCPQLTPSTSSAQTLAPGTCTALISFTPVMSGSTAGALTFYDNSNNVATASQTAALNGTATPATGTTAQTITFTQPATPAQVGTTVKLMASSDSGLAIFYSVVSGPATISGPIVTYTGTGTVVLQADQPGNNIYAPAAAAQQTVTVQTGVGVTGTAQTTTLTIATAGTLGTIYVLTTGQPNLDYTFTTGGTCTTTTVYTANATCTVNTIFTPMAPGQRMGAVQLVANDGATIMGTTLLVGTGTGPAVVFPGNTSTIALGSGFSNPFAAAVDAAGNIYVVDTFNALVKEIVAVGGTIPVSPTIRTLSSGFNTPYGVAVDGAGNVYVTDSGNFAVKELLAVGGSIPASPTIRTLGGGFGIPSAVTVDGAGNVYVGDTGNNAVYEMLAVAGSIPASPTVLTLGSGFYNPYGVAVDGAGNVYVADTNNSAVKEIVAVGGSIPANPTILTLGGSSFIGPTGVAVDGAGNVYVADYRNGAVNEMLAVAGSIPANPTILTLGSGSSFTGPTGVALDGAGNLYVADFSASAVKTIPLATPPSLSFAATSVGNTSSDSPKTLLLQNIGNASLVFPVPGTGKNPSLSASFALSKRSTCPRVATGGTAGTLMPGTCTEILSFAPAAAGSISGSFVLTDNALGATNAMQTIPLNGTGLAPSVTGIAPTSGTASGGTSVVITGTNFVSGSTVSFGAGAATSTTFNTSTQLTAIAPAGTAGAVDVTVTNAGTTTSSTSLADLFTYINATPTVTGITPTQGPTAGGTSVVITGTSFTGATGVRFGATAAAAFTVSSATQITATSPASATGGAVDINVTTANGISATSAGDVFSYIPPQLSFAAPATAVGATSATQTATLVFSANSMLNATLATAIRVVTQGSTGLDFNYVTGGTCAAGTAYTAGQSCTVQYSFTPNSPGNRQGAIALSNDAATPVPVSLAYLGGVGNGPLASITPGKISLDAGTGTLCTTANSTTACGGAATTSATLNAPIEVALDAQGNQYVANGYDFRLQRVSAGTGPGTGTVTTIAGNGTACNGVCGDGGLATAAEITFIQNVVVDGAGNIYFTETGAPTGSRVRRIDAFTGIITNFAGTGVSGTATGYGGPATNAVIGDPDGLAVDQAGNVYISDGIGRTIDVVSPATGILSIFAGQANTAGAAGNGGQATAATLNGPAEMRFDAAGTLYVADYLANNVRKITSAGVISLVAGSGAATSTGDGGPAVNATLNQPNGVAVDAGGNVYIAEGNLVRKVQASTGIITTAAGNGTAGAIGDGGAAPLAEINSPGGVSVDPAGNLYIADTPNNKIRFVNLATTAGPLTFANSAVGVASSDSPQLITVTNSGNTNLTLSAIASSSTHFKIGATGTCTATTVLTPGTACTVAVSFVPQGASAQSGTLTITDNSGASATQTVALRGTGTPATPAVSNVSNPSIAFGTANVTLSATVTFVAGIAPGGAFTFAVGTGSAVTATCTAVTSTTETCTASYPAATFNASSSGSATYAITGGLAADTNYTTASGIGTLTVNQVTPTITTNPTASAIAYGQTIASSTLSGAVASVPGSFAFTAPSTAPNAGTASQGVTFTPTDTTNYSTVTLTVMVTVNKAAASVTLGSLSATYDGSAHAATATTIPSSLAVSFTYNGTATAPTTAGNYAVVATVNDSNYSGTASGTLTIAAASAPISFAVANHTFGDAPFTVAASSASTGAFTYSVASGNATVSANTVTLTGAGSVLLKAAQAADTNYVANAQTATFTAAAGTAAITFTVPNHTYGDAPFPVSATSSSTGAFTYSVVNGPATISGGMVSLTGAGSVTLQASQAADANYTAGSTQATFTASKAAATVTLGSLSVTFDGNAHTATATTNPSGLAVGLTYNGAATAPTATGSYAVVATVNDANYSGTGNGTLVISAATAAITFAVGNHTYGDAPFAVSASSLSTGAFTYAVVSGPATVRGSVVTLTAAGTVTMQASQAADANYTANSKQAAFSVGKAVATVTLGSLSATYDGNAHAATATTKPARPVSKLPLQTDRPRRQRLPAATRSSRQ